MVLYYHNIRIERLKYVIIDDNLSTKKNYILKILLHYHKLYFLTFK